MGAAGAQGAKGEQGQPGTNGAKGEQGQPGTDGTNGTNGNDGKDGVQGPRGDAGPAGPPGPPGPSGGPQGPIGVQGMPGTPGARGEQGPQGIKGDKGDKGDVGPQGPVDNSVSLYPEFKYYVQYSMVASGEGQIVPFNMLGYTINCTPAVHRPDDSGKFIIPRTGVYLINFSLATQQNQATFVQATLLKDGETLYVVEAPLTSQSHNEPISGSVVAICSKNEEVWVNISGNTAYDKPMAVWIIGSQPGGGTTGTSPNSFIQVTYLHPLPSSYNLVRSDGKDVRTFNIDGGSASNNDTRESFKM